MPCLYLKAKKKAAAENKVVTDSSGAVNSNSTKTSNGHTLKKRRRGRPRLRPRSSTEEDEPDTETKKEASPVVEKSLPILRRRRPGCKLSSEIVSLVLAQL